MGDLLGFDPARIARLKDAQRLLQVPPQRLWEVLAAPQSGTLIDIGCGVGYMALPMARHFLRCRIVAADVLPGMLDVLRQDAAAEGLANVEPLLMEPARVPLDDGVAQLVVMLQVHHELDDPAALLVECRRLLAPGAPIALIDWQPNAAGIGPPRERMVPAEHVLTQLTAAGFTAARRHAIYPLHFCITALA